MTAPLIIRDGLKTYRIIMEKETLEKGDEVAVFLAENKWEELVSVHVGRKIGPVGSSYFPQGYYRRPCVV